MFNEVGEGSGDTFPFYIRKTDGSDAVRLGGGRAIALSPDGKWVMVMSRAAQSELTLIPTGAGESKILKNDIIVAYQDAAWFPDGEQIIVTGNEKGQRPRAWVLDAAGGKPRTITPEGVTGSLVSPDGRLLVTNDGSLYPVKGGESRPLAGLEADDYVVRFSGDSRSLYVHQTAHQYTTGDRHAKIFLLDVATGRRRLWRELAVADPAGSEGIAHVLLTPDGKSYVYSYPRLLSELYLVEGLR